MSAFYNEHDPRAAAWLRELIAQGHIAPGIVDERSITSLRPRDFHGHTQVHLFAGIGGWSLALRLAGWPDERPVWTGSCPCQPFSTAGKRKGTADARHLWPWMRHLLFLCRPPVAFGEQVASAAGRLWLHGVRGNLETLGYAVAAADLCAAGVGAPHIRQRLYWVAHGQGQGRPGMEPEREAQQRLRSRSRRRGATRGLAHASCAGQRPRESRIDRTSGQFMDGSEPGSDGLDHGAARGLGHAESDHERRERECQPVSGRPVTSGGSGAGSHGLEHPTGHGRQQRQPSPSGRRLACGCSACGLGDSALPPGARFPAQHQQLPRPATAWDHFDLIPCADGKARRIESGTFPLAHGVPHRVGLLRGYGNAIVPQLAAEFIQASQEALHPHA